MDTWNQNKENMIEYLRLGCKPKGEGIRFGVELEHFIVKQETKEAVSYYGKNGVEFLLKQMIPFYEQTEYSEGHLIALKRKDLTISLEPAAQLEVSISPQKDTSGIGAVYEQFEKEICPILKRNGYEMVTEGYQPFSHAMDLELIPKDRYRFMDAYFAGIGPYGRQMMRATAATQVSVDYFDEEDFKDKYRKLYHIKNEMVRRFSNVHVYEGKSCEDAFLREKIWQNTDRIRFDVEPFMEDDTLSFSAYADFVMQAPIIVNRENNVETYDERTIGEICSKRILSRDEMIHAMSMVFPAIRAKQFLEVRYADSMAIGRVLDYVNEIKKVLLA